MAVLTPRAYLAGVMPATTVQALPPANEIHLPNQLIVTASAGSGKTTTLTKRYLQFLLTDSIPFTSPQNILAITFTNNASNEMKERILVTLKKIALGDESIVKEMARLTGTPDNQLPAKAEKMLDEVFTNFSDFQVRTIDSFLSNVFKAMAVDFGYPPDFTLTLSSGRLFEQAFREYSERIVSSPDGMKLLRELVALVDETRSDSDAYAWNPYMAIAQKVRDLYHEVSKVSEPIVIPALDEEHRKTGEAIKKSAEVLSALAQTSGFAISQRLLDDVNDVLSDNILAAIGHKPKAKVFTAGKNKKEREQIERLEAEAATLLASFNDALHRYGLLQVRRSTLPFARALKLLEDTLHQVKRRESTVLLDDVYRLLGDSLTKDIIPDVYLKLGDRIHHYLIDEFQDTSPAQRAALRPLWEEALSGNGSLFAVGDTKQSIYGFRGADYRIMRSMIARNDFPSAPHHLATLDKNYRSRRGIVSFNRTLFRETLPSADLDSAARESGLSTDEQESGLFDKPPGRVRVFPVLRDKEANPELDAVAKVVQGWKTQGYSWRDMAILTASNANVVRVSSRLNTDGIPFISQSSLDIRNRKIIGELLALLRFLDSPVDNAAFATVLLGDILASTNSLSSEQVRDFLTAAAQRAERGPLYKAFRELHEAAWMAEFERLFVRTGFLPLYDLVAEAMHTFRVFERFPHEEASLVRFLETVRDAESAGGNSIGDFVRASDEESEDLSWQLPTPQGEDAVTIMTVHKAKGLGFPAVCVLTYPRRLRVSQPIPVPTEDGLELWHLTKGQAEQYPEISLVYEEAFLRRQVDDLNALYVSLTRAKVELAVVSAYDKEDDMPHRLFPKTEDAAPPAAEPDPFAPKPEAKRTHGGGLHSSIQIPEGPLHDRETRRGDVVHSILSSLTFIDSDPALVIQKLLEEHPPEHEGFDRETLLATLLEFLRSPDVQPLFASVEGRVVKNELEVVGADGRLHRIDRVVVDPGHVIVVDFKTGGRDGEPEYREQVKRYLRLMSDLFPAHRQTGMLAYVDLRVVVEVT